MYLRCCEFFVVGCFFTLGNLMRWPTRSERADPTLLMHLPALNLIELITVRLAFSCSNITLLCYKRTSLYMKKCDHFRRRNCIYDDIHMQLLTCFTCVLPKSFFFLLWFIMYYIFCLVWKCFLPLMQNIRSGPRIFVPSQAHIHTFLLKINKQ